MRSIVATILLACLFALTLSPDAAARARRKHKAEKPDSTTVLLHRLLEQNDRLAKELDDIKRRLNPDALARAEPEAPQEPVQLGFRNPVLEAPMLIPNLVDKTLAAYERHIAKSAKLKDLTPGLAGKVAEILDACDSRMVSGYRKGARVAGSGRPSLHSLYPSQAADLAGDPKCIYRHLAKWPGGYSVDYGRVHHVHVSLSSGGRERGARFVHYRGGGHRYASRHARSSHRYAMRRDQFQYEPQQRMHYAVAH